MADYGLVAVHHIAIICSDYSVSKHFYTEVLGGSIVAETFRKERDSYKLDIALAGIQIELFTFPGAPSRPSHPEAQGLRHLAFSVSNLEAMIATLQMNNVDVESIRVDEITGNRFTFFQDPDGLPLELVEVSA